MEVQSLTPLLSELHEGLFRYKWVQCFVPLPYPYKCYHIYVIFEAHPQLDDKIGVEFLITKPTPNFFPSDPEETDETDSGPEPEIEDWLVNNKSLINVDNKYLAIISSTCTYLFCILLFYKEKLLSLVTKSSQSYMDRRCI